MKPPAVAFAIIACLSLASLLSQAASQYLREQAPPPRFRQATETLCFNFAEGSTTEVEEVACSEPHNAAIVALRVEKDAKR